MLIFILSVLIKSLYKQYVFDILYTTTHRNRLWAQCVYKTANIKKSIKNNKLTVLLFYVSTFFFDNKKIKSIKKK